MQGTPVGDARGAAEGRPDGRPAIGPPNPDGSGQKNPPSQGGMIRDPRNQRGPTFGAEAGASGGPYMHIGV